MTIAPELKLTPPDFSMEGQFRQPNTERDIAGLRAAGAVAAAVLDEACKAVAPGVTTEEIDAVAHAACREPSTKPFPRCLLQLQHLSFATQPSANRAGYTINEPFSRVSFAATSVGARFLLLLCCYLMPCRPLLFVLRSLPLRRRLRLLWCSQ